MAKKILSLILVIALTASIAVAGTVAYLTSTDEEVNVMTLGNVKIDQIEQERTDGTQGALQGNLQEFTQSKGAYPYTGTSEKFDNVAWDDDHAFGLDNTKNNVVDKFVTVKNTGSSEAYVRTLFAFERGSDSANLVAMTEKINGTDWTWEEDVCVIELDGSYYTVAVATYKTSLASGETTLPSLLQVYLNSDVTNEDVERLGETWEIRVLSQAVQTEGFADAATALNTAFGAVTNDKALEWFKGVESPDFITGDETDDDFENAVTGDDKNIKVILNKDVTYDVAAWNNEAIGGAATETITIDGGGHTIDFYQSNSDWNNIVTNGATLIIKNAHITNSGNNDGPWNRHDINFACNVVLENVTSDKAIALRAGGTLTNVTINDENTVDTYALWIQPNGQTVTLNGCTINMLDCTDGRGIKIDEQYVGTPAKVTLKVSDTTFKTEEKSAILVKSVAGADIILSNVNINEVAADSVNPVWVDGASAAYADLVTVTGGSKIVEP